MDADNLRSNVFAFDALHAKVRVTWVMQWQWVRLKGDSCVSQADRYRVRQFDLLDHSW